MIRRGFRTIVLGLLWLGLIFGATVEAQVADGVAGRQVELLPLVFTGADDRQFFTSTLSVMNLGGTTIEVAVAAFADGEEAAVFQSVQTGEAALVAGIVLRLEPGEAVRRTLHPRIWAPDLFPLRHAWLHLSSAFGDRFAASIRITGIQGRAPLEDSAEEVDVDGWQIVRHTESDIQIDSIQPSNHFKALAAWDGGEFCPASSLSAYALVNPTREDTEVRFRFWEKVEPGNWLLHEARRKVRAQTRIAFLISELFPELFPPKLSLAPCRDVAVHETGVLDIRSGSGIGVSALKVNVHTGHFVDLPVRVIERSETDPE